MASICSIKSGVDAVIECRNVAKASLRQSSASKVPLKKKTESVQAVSVQAPCHRQSRPVDIFES